MGTHIPQMPNRETAACPSCSALKTLVPHTHASLHRHSSGKNRGEPFPVQKTAPSCLSRENDLFALGFDLLTGRGEWGSHIVLDPGG